jgi:hypothetical protein
VTFVDVLDAPHNHASVIAIVRIALDAVFKIAFAVVGALILSRLARNRIGGLLMFIGVATGGIGALVSLVASGANSGAEPTLTDDLLVWLSMWSWWLLMGPLFLLLLIFPTGRLLSRRWRCVVGMLGLLFASFLAVVTLSPEWRDTESGRVVANRFVSIGTSAALPIEAFLGPWSIALAGTALLCVLSVFVRYRRADVVERRQLNWFLFTCAFFITLYVFSAIGQPPGVGPPEWAGVLLSFVFVAFPVSIGIAILRHRLFDIDLIVRRTFTYAIISAALAIVYFGANLIAQGVISALGGQRNELAIVASTLAVAALFSPVRRRVQEAIDQRFNRQRYDADKVVADFADYAAHETDLAALQARIVGVVAETIQPKQVTVWVKGESVGRSSTRDR